MQSKNGIGHLFDFAWRRCRLLEESRGAGGRFPNTAFALIVLVSSSRAPGKSCAKCALTSVMAVRARRKAQRMEHHCTTVRAPCPHLDAKRAPATHDECAQKWNLSSGAGAALGERHRDHVLLS